MALAASATDALDLDVSAKCCKYKATCIRLAGNGVISVLLCAHSSHRLKAYRYFLVVESARHCSTVRGC